MLDKGFENDIRKIISYTAADRQTMMCTFLATILASYPNILHFCSQCNMARSSAEAREHVPAESCTRHSR
jgi:hypothetical protein